MRTTIDIEARALERAKKLAAASGRTLGEVVSAALTAYAAGRPAARAAEPFELVVRGRRGGRFPEPSDISRILDEEDASGLVVRGLVKRGRRAPA